MALADPPSAVICDLWLASNLRRQLYRLLRARPATMSVPIVLRSGPTIHGAASGRVTRARGVRDEGPHGRVVRLLDDVIEDAPDSSTSFFFRMSGAADLRDHSRSTSTRRSSSRWWRVRCARLERQAPSSACSTPLSQLMTQLVSTLLARGHDRHPAYSAVHAPTAARAESTPRPGRLGS